MNQPKPYRFIVEGLLFLLYFSFGVSWLAYAPIITDLESHFGVNHTEGAMMISLVSLAKAFVPLFAGVLAARLGLKRALLLGASLSALAALVPLAPSFKALLVGRFFFGVGGAIVVTLMGPTVMAWFPRNELPMVNGLNNVAVNAGICLALFITVPTVKSFGWQNTLIGFGLVSAALTAAWALLGRDGGTSGDGESAKADDDATLSELFKRRETWMIAMAFTGPLSLYLALNTWLPSHYQAAFGLTKQAASSLTGLFNLVGIPAALCGGYLTGKLGLRRPLVILSGTLMPVAALGLIASPHSGLRVVSACVLGASFFLYVAPLFTIPMELPGMTPNRVALMMGCVFSLSYIVSFISPLLVGKIQEVTGSFLPGLALFALTSGTLALGAYLLPETGPKKTAVTPVREEKLALAS